MTHHPSVPGEAATESSLIGREHEQRQLLALFEGVLRGRGAVVLLSGEAGIGKTALVHDLVN